TNLSGFPKKLLDQFTSVGINIILKDITSDLQIPTIAAVSDDVTLKDPKLLTIGMGTHTNPEMAVIRALTEVAQSRATQIHGAREDTTIAAFREMMGYERVKRMNNYWFKVTEKKDYSNIIGQSSNDFKIDILNIIDKLKTNGLNHVLVANITDCSINIPVVRVIVPGLECYSIDSERRGDRCIHAEYCHIHRTKSTT
ncbi:MAG TPA: YcaO-like family protein, partial [Methanocorpusculum sp.]|nr:YcaO-like family protein [Methanocorpusculum sp.]